MPTRHRNTEPVPVTPVYEKDEAAGKMIDAILAKYPGHKRVLFLKGRYETNHLKREDVEELGRFMRQLKIS